MCDIPLRKEEEISTSCLKSAIKSASSLGARTIVFSGGEPLLREDLYELIAFAKANHMSACLTSNGVMLGQNAALALAESGINVVNISIEGNREIHDSLRGVGNFDKAVKALEYLRESGIEATIAATVSRYNYHSLLEVVELARAYKVTTVRFQPFSQIFIDDQSRKTEFFLNQQEKQELEKAIREVIRLTQEYGISTNPLNYLNRISDYLCGENIVSGNACSALWSSCPINARGDVFPCWVLADKRHLLGNISEKKLSEIWLSSGHQRIRQGIVKNGCGGCMMSCYDDVFGQGPWQATLVKKIRRLKAPGLPGRLKDRLIQDLKSRSADLKEKAKFYCSYRGSISRIFKRISGIRQREKKLRGFDKEAEIKECFLEIRLAKEKLKREMGKL